MTKLEEMNLDEIIIEIDKVRNDVQYLGEKLDRKRSWRDALLRRKRILEREVDSYE